MDNLWYEVDSLPYDDLGMFTVNGDKDAAVQKDEPILWKYHNNWVILKVFCTSKYRLYKNEGLKSFCYRDLISEKFFATRVEREDIYFLALDHAIGAAFEISLRSEKTFSFSQMERLSFTGIKLV